MSYNQDPNYGYNYNNLYSNDPYQNQFNHLQNDFTQQMYGNPNFNQQNNNYGQQPNNFG